MAIAKKLSALLYQHPHVTGVAVTGSAGRLEDHIHDLDLIVLHDGKLPDGLAPCPMWHPDPYGWQRNLFLRNTLGNEAFANRLERAQKKISVDYIFVHEKVLTNCLYLMERGETAYDHEFFKRIFCELPLRLLLPGSAKGVVKKGVGPKVAGTIQTSWCASVPYKNLAHDCGSAKCRPEVLWAHRKIQRQIERMTFGHSGY